MAATGFEYAITRTLNAPAGEVWGAWTVAEDYGKWASAEEVVMDVRPGGSWSSVMVIPGGVRVPLTGSYAEVVEHERLVMGMDVPGRGEPVLMCLDLAADGEGTRVTLSQTLDGAGERDEAEQGSTMLLDGLAAHLAA